MGQRRLEWVREQRRKEEEAEVSYEEEEEGGGFVAGLNNLTTETAGTAEETAEGLEAALGMASQEMEVDEYSGNKGEDEGGGT